MAHDYDLPNNFVHEGDKYVSQIRWTRVGTSSGPPLIFVHGTPWSNGVWRDLAECLCDRYAVYVYDHPGFGASPSPKAREGTVRTAEGALDASLEVRASASAALIRHMKLPCAPHIVAHDNGGLTSLRMLLQHDIKFASLCLVDVVTTTSEGRVPFFKSVAENLGVYQAIPPKFLEGLARAYIRDASYKGLSSEVEDALHAQWLPSGTQGPDRFLQEMIQAHYRSTGGLEREYSRVCQLVPTKVIWGKEDATLPVEKAYMLKAAVGAQEMTIIEGAGHLIHYDQPSKLALEIGLWLEKNRK